MTIKSVGKAIEIINYFSISKPVFGISEIAR